MTPLLRNSTPDDLSGALRVLEETAIAAQSEPLDLERIVTDIQHGAVGATALASDEVIGPAHPGRGALESRGFDAAEGLVRYQKKQALEPEEVHLVKSWGGEMCSAGLWDEVAGMEREKTLIESRMALRRTPADRTRQR